MAVLKQFAQGENTKTKKVLLMLSTHYEFNPKYHEEFIEGLTENEQYEIILNFRLQVGNRGV